ncbi:hypothetical protein VHEMI07213 [[Torrubiella] hemipterigena]|nr:hypothetical protein VHEMI07213 [[Torrubiella] hemipterigena]
MLGCCARVERYLYEIPMRSGYSEALDSAVDCVAAALHVRYSHGSLRAKYLKTALMLYGRTLKQLQKALDDREKSLSTLTLCATQLLFLYEALTLESTQPTTHHARGTTQLIQHLGPKRFVTAFDKAILLAQAPISYLQSYATSTHCIFEEQEWQQAMISIGEVGAGHTTLDEAAATAIAICSVGPGIIADWKDLVLNHENDNRRRIVLLSRVNQALCSFQEFVDVWGVDLLKTPHTNNNRITDGFLLQEIVRFRLRMAYIALGGLQSGAAHIQATNVARDITMRFGCHNRTPHSAGVTTSRRLVESVLSAAALNIIRCERSWRRCAVVNDDRVRRGEQTKLLPQSITLEYLANFGPESIVKDKELYKSGYFNDIDRWCR